MVMGKLYVFGIGGTGARVIRSLTFLLSAGVKCDSEIVPVIIDPDLNNGDLTRTVELLHKYQAIRQKLSFEDTIENRFYRTEIIETIHNFQMPLRNTLDVTFEQYMNVGGMNEANQALMRMLFSEKNLNSRMEVGFKGNPNIGSIVLNQFSESVEFTNFANSFTQNDRIFIVNSIFGGTGASGFPLLLKTLRTNQTLPQHALLNNALIGGITVLPYFTVNKDANSEIESDTFIAKTKSALHYYQKNVTGNNSIDVLYYVGDNEGNTHGYQNSEGGKTQKNKAHLIEFISALAILDFESKYTDRTGNVVCKEYGMESKGDAIIFGNLGSVTNRMTRIPLTQYLMFSQYLKNVSASVRDAQQWVKEKGFDKTFWDSDFMQCLVAGFHEFESWLDEMADNRIAFSPFTRTIDKPFDIVQGITPQKSFWLSKDGYQLFDKTLNNKQKGLLQGASKEKQFVELFYVVTKLLLQEKLNLR